jgi:tRNA threonylcarbamoyl adenosine modification protein YjeE
MPSNDPTDSANSDTVAIADLASLDRFASRLAACLPATAVITLEGDLGAGKTTLVKAVAAAAGIDPAEVTSPTFSLIQIHDAPTGDLQLIHADMYRLSDPDELQELGWEELLEPAEGLRRLIFLEWPQRIAAALPENRLAIRITITGETSRRLFLSGFGAEYATIPALAAGSA